MNIYPRLRATRLLGVKPSSQNYSASTPTNQTPFRFVLDIPQSCARKQPICQRRELESLATLCHIHSHDYRHRNHHHHHKAEQDPILAFRTPTFTHTQQNKHMSNKHKLAHNPAHNPVITLPPAPLEPPKWPCGGPCCW